MEIHSANFVKSSANVKQLPDTNFPEYGFVGRSNVGKSSLINRLLERRKLAKTSSTPGKTQLINHFLINNSWYIADLPGYGYAKVSKTKRAGFVGMITDYVTTRKNLMNLYVLLDSRIKPQEIDMEFLEFLGVNEIPFTILFTKIDKLNQKAFSASMKNYKHALAQKWEEFPPMISTSAVNGKGIDALRTQIEEINSLWKGV